MRLAIALILSWLITTAFAQTEPGAFLLLSDIHFDPYLLCEKDKKPCPTLQALIKAPYTDWQKILDIAPPKLSQYGEDTSYTLFKSALHMAHDVLPHPDFIISPGDFLAHNSLKHYQQYAQDTDPKHYQTFIKKLFYFLNQQIRAQFPHTPIYNAVGHSDNFTHHYQAPSQDFYQFLKSHTVADSWYFNFKDQQNQSAFDQHFPQGGHYSIKLPHSPVRLIVLNTVLPSHETGKNNTAQSDAQFHWLREQLELARLQKEPVWLMMPIPIGINAYLAIKGKAPSYLLEKNSARLYTLIQQYKETVRYLIAGHIHVDAFFRQENKQADTLFTIIAPAISPIISTNPAFKVAQYNPRNGNIINTQTYTLNLKEKEPTWHIRYNFNQLYNPLCHKNCLIQQGMRLLEKTGPTSEHYIDHYALGGMPQPIRNGYWYPYYWCAANHLLTKDFETCVKRQ